MASELETSLRNATAKVAEYVENIATLTVETKYVQIGDDGMADFAAARPVARTEIRFDSDSKTVIPMRTGKEGQPEVDAELLNIHQTTVTTAIEYRSRMLNMLLDMLRGRPRTRRDHGSS
jgi:hypothetical protein